MGTLATFHLTLVRAMTDDLMDFDIMSVLELERARELLEECRDVLIDVEARMKGAYEPAHPSLFRDIAELRQTLEDEVL